MAYVLVELYFSVTSLFSKCGSEIERNEMEWNNMTLESVTSMQTIQTSELSRKGQQGVKLARVVQTCAS